MIDDGYEAFSDVVTLCIELIRQFYGLPRQFRLLGGEFASYDNAGLQPVAMSDGVEISYRVPVFDLEISAQQENPYKTMEYNQLALQLFQMGFFREDMAPQALRCLELMQAAAVVDQVKGTHLAQQLAQEYAAAQKNAKGSAWQAGKLNSVERTRRSTREAVRPR